VSLENETVNESLVTVLTNMGSLACMGSIIEYWKNVFYENLLDMPVKTSRFDKPLVTVRALMGAVASMGSKRKNKQTSSGNYLVPDMSFKVTLLGTEFIAIRALERALACMGTVMIFTRASVFKRFFAIITHKLVHL